MHYKTVKDVIDHSRRLHQQISKLYKNIKQKQTQERVKMLLDYLQRHEEHLEKSLSQFEHDKSQKVLDSWFQYAPDQDLSEILSTIEINDHMDSEEVIIMALKLDDYFIELYESMVTNSSSPSVKAVFQNLLDMEQQEKIRTARTALNMHDM
jgi:rubrerythrin